MNKRSLVYNLVTVVLRVALVGALIWAGWNVYERLPVGATEEPPDAASQTSLVIILRPSPKEASKGLDIPVQLYPVDLSAVQREYGFEPRPGVRFEDFLSERMKGRAPLKVQLDDRGQATITLSPGRWWVHALLSGSQNVEWRVPVVVSGHQQTIELNAGNVYAKTKSF